MINPDIVKEYGENGAKILEGFCAILTPEERDSVYAVEHNIISRISGVPFEITCTDESMLSTIRLKTMDYFFSVDGDTIVLCELYNGEGIKLWHTIQ